MKPVLIYKAKIINEGNAFKGSLLIEDGKISKIFKDDVPESVKAKAEIIDGEDKWVLPGVIDTHVHFRDPGMTQKADFLTESRAAVAGGVTSVMDMPNTSPATTTMALWEQKTQELAKRSLVNFSCYMGATDNNVDEIMKIDPKKVCGLKLFMGSTTSSFVVNDKQKLEEIFAKSPVLIATHNEDDNMIKENLAKVKAELGEDKPIPMFYHSVIRNSDACYKSTAAAIDLALKHHTHLHVLHLSTLKELALFERIPEDQKDNITAETTVNYLWFADEAYERLGARIKCCPSIKKGKSREGLQKGVADGIIDTIATDHAPHLLSEKEGDAITAASGIPSIQHSLPMMLELAKKGAFTREQVVEKMCHNPAKIFGVEKRGFIRKGYYADLVIVAPNNPYTVDAKDLQYKCGWSPLEGEKLSYKVEKTFVNGNLVYDEGKFNEEVKGQILSFAR